MNIPEGLALRNQDTLFARVGELEINFVLSRAYIRVLYAICKHGVTGSDIKLILVRTTAMILSVSSTTIIFANTDSTCMRNNQMIARISVELVLYPGIKLEGNMLHDGKCFPQSIMGVQSPINAKADNSTANVCDAHYSMNIVSSLSISIGTPPGFERSTTHFASQ